MTPADLIARLTGKSTAVAPASAIDLSDGPHNRAQMTQRLQIGISGIVFMFLLVGLASVLERRADEAEAVAIPEAAPTMVPDAPNSANDPLVSAGVVPDLPAEPEPTPRPSPTAAPTAVQPQPQ